MNSIIKPISTVDTWYLECSKTSVQLLNKAISTKNLPFRMTHIITLGYVLVFSPFSILSRIISFSFTIFRLFTDFIFYDYKIERLIYNGMRVILLDPLYITSGIIAVVIQLISSILGILFPVLGAHGWKLAENIEICVLKLYCNVKYNLNICDRIDTLYAIKPYNAINYLGMKRAKSLYQIGKTQSGEELRCLLISAFKCIQCYPKYFNRFLAPTEDQIQKMSMKELVTLGKKLKPVPFFSFVTSGLSLKDYNGMLQMTTPYLNEIEEQVLELDEFGGLYLQ